MIFWLCDCWLLSTAFRMSEADNPAAQAQHLVQLRSDLAKLTQQIPYDTGETILHVLQRVDQLSADFKFDAKLL